MIVMLPLLARELAASSPRLLLALCAGVSAGLALRSSSRHSARKQQRLPPPPAAAVLAPVPPAPEATLPAPWMRPLKKALNHGGTQRKTRDRSAAKRKHLQLATVDAAGHPSVRTVVFRGFLPRKFCEEGGGGESTCLMFITDDRSAKYRHLGGCASTKQQLGPVATPVEAFWWLDEAGVQFRIRGHATLATAQSNDPGLRAAVEEVWGRLGPSSRGTFFWPCPGAPVAPSADGTQATADGKTRGAAGECLLDSAHFALLILVPDRVDELHLGGRQRRVVYHRQCRVGSDALAAPSLGRTPASTCDAVWTEQHVNP